LVGIEEVANRNNLKLYKTSHPGQWKARCPVCQDSGRDFHLYVSTDKDAFYCHKCGERGGVIAFHAWLRGVDEATAKTELYPQVAGRPQRRRHPAEQLTVKQLHEIGFTRRPRYTAPSGADPAKWRKHYRASLDWIWEEWCAYEKLNREISERLTKLLMQSDQAHIG
jgi:hypothetical protein